MLFAVVVVGVAAVVVAVVASVVVAVVAARNDWNVLPK